MLNKKVADLLENQINKELYSAYLYLDMSNYYYANNLDGFGNWYKIQAQEERDHAMLFLEYLQNNGEAPKLTAIDAPDKAFKTFRDPPSTPPTRRSRPSGIPWPPPWSTRSM